MTRRRRRPSRQGNHSGCAANDTSCTASDDRGRAEERSGVAGREEDIRRPAARSAVASVACSQPVPPAPGQARPAALERIRRQADGAVRDQREPVRAGARAECPSCRSERGRYRPTPVGRRPSSRASTPMCTSPQLPAHRVGVEPPRRVRPTRSTRTSRPCPARARTHASARRVLAKQPADRIGHRCGIVWRDAAGQHRRRPRAVPRDSRSRPARRAPWPRAREGRSLRATEGSTSSERTS